MKTGKVFPALSVVIISLSLLTAFRILPGYDIVGMVLAFFTLFILPGIYIDLLLFGRMGVSVERFLRVFLTGTIYLSLLVCLGFIPGVDYPIISIVSAAALLSMAGAAYFGREREVDRVEEDLVGSFRDEEELSGRERKALLLLLVFLFAFLFIFFQGRGELGVDTDSLDHVSYIRRSLDSGEIFPSDSFFREGDGGRFDPRKGIWHPVLSLFVFQADVDPVFLWRMLPSIFSIFVFAAFWLFARELLGSALLSFVSVGLLVLFARGEGVAWFAKAGYPRNLSQMVFWASTAYMIRYFRGKRTWNICFSALLVVVSVAVHISAAMLTASVLGALMIYTSVRGWGDAWQKRFWSAVPLLAAAVVLPVILRVAFGGAGGFNFIHTHRQGMLLLGGDLAIVDPVELMSAEGLAFFFAVAISPFTFLITPKRRETRLVTIMFLLPVVAVLNPLTATLMEKYLGYLHYRMLQAAPTMCILSLALSGLVRMLLTGRGPRREKKVPLLRGTARRLVAVSLIALFAMIPLRFGLEDAVAYVGAGARTGAHGEDRQEELFEDILEGVPPHSVIMSDPNTSYQISAFTDHFVLVIPGQHGSPLDEAAMTRLERTRDFFCPSAEIKPVYRWLRVHGVRYLLIDTEQSEGPGFFNTAPKANVLATVERLKRYGDTFGLNRRTDRYILFDLADIPPPDSTADGALSGISSGRCAPGMMEGYFSPAAGCEGLTMEGFSLENGILSPGDTLSGSFCWSSNGVGFGLPYEWFIRLDTGYAKGPFFRRWYDKQYRRIVERRRGELYRYTVTGPVVSGYSFPDQWNGAGRAGQDFSLVIPAGMAGGEYEVKAGVRRVPYLQNKRISDYLRNSDSLRGASAGKITIE